jgi:integrase
MYLTKSKSGIWKIQYINVEGRKTKVSTRTTSKSEALEFFRTFKFEQKPVSRKVLFKNFETKFIEYASRTFSPGHVALYQKAFLHFNKFFGNIPLKAITGYHWDKFKIERQKSHLKDHTTSPVTINIELRCLKASLNTAVRWNMLESNPFAKQKQCPVPETLPTFFTKEEIQILMNSITAIWLKEIVLFAVMTGLRQGEIIHLRWQDVQFERRTISIQSSEVFRTKTGKRRVIPMNDMTYALLQKKLTERMGNFVFSMDGSIIDRGYLTINFKRAVKKAGMTDPRLHFHSLRHTFASWLVQSGVSLYEVQKLLGHKTASVTQIYSHLLPDQMHSTVNRINI